MLAEIMLCNNLDLPLLDDDSAKELSGKAKGEDSNVEATLRQQSIDLVRWEDLHIGKMLGSGSFNAVFDVRLKEVVRLPFTKKTRSKEARTSSPVEESVGTTTTDACSDWSRYTTDRSDKFAIKCVSDQTFENHQARDAAEGLRNEVKILLSLPKHKHIIEMVAISPDFDLTGFKPACSESFLILNQLSITLDQYILRVKARLVRSSPCLTAGALQQFLPSADKKRSIRVGSIGLAVARALEFLHRHNVIYRDLKPSNIGFDFQHNVRLFDFGLSHMAPPGMHPGVLGNNSDEATYYLTTFVGTPLYMAPEVRGNPFYDNRVDVFSFGFLLRELYTLEPPPIVRRSLLWQAHQGIANPQIRALVRDCTKVNRSKRPSMARIVSKVEGWNHKAIP